MITKPLVLIVEGPDRCGKSTFIESFRSVLTEPALLTIHSSKPPKDINNPEDLREWAINYNSNLLSSVNNLMYSGFTDVVILDRSYLGEYIYGRLYRDIPYTNADFTSFENDFVKDLMKHSHVVLVNFTNSYKDMMLREDGKSYDKGVGVKNKEISLFVELHNLSIIENKILIDWNNVVYSGVMLEDLSNKIINHWINSQEGI